MRDQTGSAVCLLVLWLILGLHWRWLRIKWGTFDHGRELSSALRLAETFIFSTKFGHVFCIVPVSVFNCEINTHIAVRRVSQCLILIVSSPVSGCDDAPAVTSCIWSNYPILIHTNRTTVHLLSVVQGRFHTCSSGSDQTEKSEEVKTPEIIYLLFSCRHFTTWL